MTTDRPTTAAGHRHVWREDRCIRCDRRRDPSILHWPNDPRIPGCNENCHRAEARQPSPERSEKDSKPTTDAGKDLLRDFEDGLPEIIRENQRARDFVAYLPTAIARIEAEARQPSPERRFRASESEKDSEALLGCYEGMAHVCRRCGIDILAALPSNVSEPPSGPHANEPGWFDEWDLLPSDPPDHDINCGIDALRLGEDIGCTCGAEREPPSDPPALDVDKII